MWPWPWRVKGQKIVLPDAGCTGGVGSDIPGVCCYREWEIVWTKLCRLSAHSINLCVHWHYCFEDEYSTSLGRSSYWHIGDIVNTLLKWNVSVGAKITSLFFVHTQVVMFLFSPSPLYFLIHSDYPCPPSVGSSYSYEGEPQVNGLVMV